MASTSASNKSRKRARPASSNGSAPKAKSAKSSTSARSKTKASTRSKPTASSQSKPTASSQSKPTAASRKRSQAKRSSNSDQSITAKAANGASQVADTAKGVAGKAKGPALAVGAAAAGVAGGMALKGKLSRKSVLGVKVPRSVDARSITKTVGEASKKFAEASKGMSRDLDRAGDQAERLGRILSRDDRDDSGRRSPIEVVLDGLTHRPGAGGRNH
jgi:hypothetical protein